MPVPESSQSPPKLSVVMACYNRERDLKSAVDSVLAQDYEDYEIIVVDDGSTDKTGEIAKSYGDKIRYLYQKNRGVGGARNTGVRAARGEYLAYCDADDIQFPFRLRAQVELLDQSPDVGMVFADFKEWIDGEWIRHESLLRHRWLGPTDRTFEEDIAYHFARVDTCEARGITVPEQYKQNKVYEGQIDGWLCTVHAAWGCAQMSRTEAIREVGGHWEAIRAYEDYVLSVEVCKRHKMIYLDVPICDYRVHSEQLTGRQRLNAECFRDSLLHSWRADNRWYVKHKTAIDQALGTAYAVIGEVEARDGNFKEAEEAFKRAVFEWPAVGRRPYLNLFLTALKHRVPMGPLGKMVPGFLAQSANTGKVVEE